MKLTKLKAVFLAMIPLLIGLDQLFKFLAVRYLISVDTVCIIPNLFHLTYVENFGAAFGIFTNRKFLLIAVTSAALLGMLVFMLSRKVISGFAIVSLSLIVSGGFGNLLDRVFRGFVVDYLQFVPFDFPVFNFADCCVVIGTFLLVFYLLFEDWYREKKKKSAAGSEDGRKDESQKL